MENTPSLKGPISPQESPKGEKGSNVISLANEILTRAGELREGGLRDDVEPALEYKNAPGVVVMDACGMARTVLNLLDTEVAPDERTKIRNLANEILTRAGELREGGLRDDVEPALEYKNAPGVVMDACGMARTVLNLLDKAE